MLDLRRVLKLEGGTVSVKPAIFSRNHKTSQEESLFSKDSLFSWKQSQSSILS